MDGSQREDEHEHKAAFSWAPDLSPHCLRLKPACLFFHPLPPKHTWLMEKIPPIHPFPPPIPPCLRPTNFSVPYFSFYTTLATLRLCFDCVL